MKLYQDDLDRLLVASRGAAVDLSRAEHVDLPVAAILLVHLHSGGAWIPPQTLVVRSWLRRVGFTAALEGGPPPERDSDSLLAFTRIETDADVAALLERLHGRAPEFLARHLHFTAKDAARFTITLAELCHNIPEHACGPGWVAIHRYKFRGRNILKIAVADAGRGVRASYGERFGSDLEAIKAAFEDHRSRHDDPGRGHGLREVVKAVKGFEGKITVRSGEAKKAHVSDGMLGWRSVSGLVSVPGTQVLISVPERGVKREEE
ncbi:MAG: ATP-binding protein [Planctomycetes bacterium]|nr:ATP-binding protein [Planctomycetota bacterium]